MLSFLPRLRVPLLLSLLSLSSSLPSLVSSQPMTGVPACASNDGEANLQSLVLSQDAAENIEFQIKPNFGSFIYSYTATLDPSLTTVYVTPTGSDVLQQLFIRVNEGDYQSINSGTAQQITLTGKGATDQVYVFVTCHCYVQYQLSLSVPGSKITGDPQFTGLKGQSYQIHGIPHEYYNLITDSYIQYNSQFVFLTQGQCPVVNGVTQTRDCWTHPGTYLGEIGLKTNAGDKLHVIAGDRFSGFKSVSFNGKPIKIGEVGTITFDPSISAALPYPSYFNYTDTHTLTVHGAGFYTITLTNSDWFVNQQVEVLNWSTINSHGLLGQTWHKPTTKGQIKEIEGYVDDYLILDHQLWGDNFVYNQFQLPQNATTPAATTQQSKTKSKAVKVKSAKSKVKAKSSRA